MKDDWRLLLERLADSPVMFGIVAAIARWAIGERAGGLWALFTYLSTSLLVAWGASYYLADEGLTRGRQSAYLLLLAFVAKDLLTAIVGLAAQFGANPLAVVRRVREAINGGPLSGASFKSDEPSGGQPK